jgi:hypothetical protein
MKKEVRKLINKAESGEFIFQNDMINYLYTEYDSKKADKILAEFNKRYPA